MEQDTMTTMTYVYTQFK